MQLILLSMTDTVDKTCDLVIEVFKKCKKVLIICGAGVSVSCGIPDFRTKDVGLYNTLDCVKIGLPSPELLFDSEYFELDPIPFYKFAASMLLPHPSKPITQPSLSHRFFKLLEMKHKLLRVYTQNIDGLEEKAGIQKVFQCHGSMSKFQCTNMRCRKKVACDEVMIQEIQKNHICYCQSCSEVMKPCITFFGDNVPCAFEKQVTKDLQVNNCDVILVTGTSLLVGGSVYELLKRFEKYDNDDNYIDNKSLALMGQKAKKMKISDADCESPSSSSSSKRKSSNLKPNTKRKAPTEMDIQLTESNINTDSAKAVMDVKKKSKKICRILVNKDLITERKNFPFEFDYILLGECDVIFEYLSLRLGWDLSVTAFEAVERSVLQPDANNIKDKIDVQNDVIESLSDKNTANDILITTEDCDEKDQNRVINDLDLVKKDTPINIIKKPRVSNSNSNSSSISSSTCSNRSHLGRLSKSAKSYVVSQGNDNTIPGDSCEELCKTSTSMNNPCESVTPVENNDSSSMIDDCNVNNSHNDSESSKNVVTDNSNTSNNRCHSSQSGFYNPQEWSCTLVKPNVFKIEFSGGGLYDEYNGLI